MVSVLSLVFQTKAANWKKLSMKVASKNYLCLKLKKLLPENAFVSSLVNESSSLPKYSFFGVLYLTLNRLN